MKECIAGVGITLGVYVMGLAIGYKIGRIDGETKTYARVANDLKVLIDGIEETVGGGEKEA